MRVTSVVVFIATAAMQVLTAEESFSQLLERKVNVSYERTNAYTVIKDLQRNEHIDFAFTNNLGLETIELKSLRKDQVSLADLLKQILADTRIAYEEKSGVVTLFKEQEPGTVSGSVTNAAGEPLAGATFRVAETGRTYRTDAQGKIMFSLQPGTYTVDITYISYQAQRHSIQVTERGQVPLVVVLQDALDELGEVVVVGYGTQQRNKVTGAISQVKSEDLNQYHASGFAQQLAGRVSGVMINESNGMPGADPQIIVRGISTLTAGVKPLIVVDGFPLTEGSSLNSINPKDIETIDILKDPASASIYGSRAANGVIMVTTKKAGEDKVTVNFDAYTGFQQRADNMKLIDAYQAATYFTEARDQAYVSKDPANRSITDDHDTRIGKGASKRDLRLHYIDPYLANTPGLTNVNWLDEIFRTAPLSSYTLSVSGRTGAVTDYYVSGSYFDQDGIVLGSDLKRYSANLKLHTQLAKRLRFGANLVPTFTDRNYHNELGTARGNFPFFSPYNEDGSLAVSTQIIANTPEDGALNESAVALTEMVTKKRKDFRTFGHSFLEFEPVDGLTFKTLLGGDFATVFDDYFNPSNVGAYRAAAPKPAAATETQAQLWNYLTENTVTYDKQLAKHHINLLGGYSFQQERSNQTKVSGTGIPDDNLSNIAGASNFSVNASRHIWTQVSYWTRLQYDYASKYLLTATFRRDGSSRFGSDSKWGNFPSVSAGWIVSNEDFMASGGAVDFLKLRASWGMAGNNQVGSYGSLALLSAGNYVYGETLAPGYYASTAPNPGLSWETQKAWNVGVDITAFNRFNLTVNYYDTRTSDLLLNVPVPEQSGYSSSLQNIGEIQNAGVEVDFGATGIQLGQVSWTFNANLSTNRNEVLSLAEGQDQIISGNFLTRVGGPIAEIYGYNILGIYKSQEAIDQTPHIGGTRVGDNIVEDVDGDGAITPNDRTTHGTYAPKLTYGFQSSFRYKGLDFGFGLSGVEGRKVYDGNLAGHENGEAFVLATEYYFKNRYHPISNPGGTMPQPTTTFSQNRLQTGWASSWHFYDADFLRVRYIQLGYQLPERMLNPIKVTNLRVYLQSNNPFTWTPYRGFNPEGTSDNVLESGAAGNNYPVARSFTVGVNLTF